MSERWQHLIIGAGHNGLVCAALLARRGRRVLVLESAGEVGGAARTREFLPGFRVSGCAHLLDALPERIERELALAHHGLRFASRGLATTALDPAGAHVSLEGATVRGVGARDAQSYARFCRQMDRHAALLGRVLGLVPFGPALDTWGERRDALLLALRLRLMGRRDMRELLRIGGMNAYDLLGDHFESPLLQGALGLDATLGAESAARSPGTVLTLLHRWAGLAATGGRGVAQPIGGMGAVTRAMAGAAKAAGVRIRTGARVRRILVEGDRACGVELESGESIAAHCVVSNADPKTTLLGLLGAQHLDTDFVRRVDHFRSRGLVAKLHLALDRLPRFPGLEDGALGGRLLVSPSLDALELAFDPSKYRKVPDRPVLEVTLPSVGDPGLAPPGRHVLSANVMFVPYDLGPDPQGAHAILLEAVLATLERHAPGLRASILGCELLTPRDLEREFGMTGGHWHHGALAFDQYFFARPVPGAARYASPVAGLYLCGAGCHPGGGVSGWAGRNAARVILAQGGDDARQ
jgi:phytoene dehydrogenase-like protein